MKVKLNKEFKMTYIINSILYIISISIIGYIIFISNKNEIISDATGLGALVWLLILVFQLFAITSTQLFIVNLVVGINTYKKNQSKLIRKKILIMLIILSICHMPYIIYFICNILPQMFRF